MTLVAALKDASYTVGDIRKVGYAVVAGSEEAGWLLCDGRPVSRSTYLTLFNKIGTAYGIGDGSTTFNLPDAQGRVMIGTGQGAGLTLRALGAKGGVEKHPLVTTEMPNRTATRSEVPPPSLLSCHSLRRRRRAQTTATTGGSTDTQGAHQHVLAGTTSARTPGHQAAALPTGNDHLRPRLLDGGTQPHAHDFRTTSRTHSHPLHLRIPGNRRRAPGTTGLWRRRTSGRGRGMRPREHVAVSCPSLCSSRREPSHRLGCEPMETWLTTANKLLLRKMAVAGVISFLAVFIPAMLTALDEIEGGGEHSFSTKFWILAAGGRGRSRPARRSGVPAVEPHAHGRAPLGRRERA